MEVSLEEPLPLRALAAPLKGSPFAAKLSFLHQQPLEIEAKRLAALRREVQRLLRHVYRRSVEVGQIAGVCRHFDGARGFRLSVSPRCALATQGAKRK